MSRALVESLAVEGYRSGRLSTHTVGQMLGHESRWQTQDFLAEHDAWPAQTVEEFEKELSKSRTPAPGMIVVTDVSPLHYLVLIDAAHLLEHLYGNVVCPETVLAECAHPHAPDKLRLWATHPPAWLHVVRDAPHVLPGLDHLDAGERSAIQTAHSLAATVIMHFTFFSFF